MSNYQFAVDQIVMNTCVWKNDEKKLHFTCDGENSTSVYHYAQNEAFTEWYFNYSAQGVDRERE
jgi:hypothetical protein